jgi:ankyrin repeat protein
MLIPKGAQINLNTACVLNRPEDVKKILDKDPTLADNPLGKEKGTPLEVALEAGAEEVCALLLEKKVKLKSSGRSRRGLLQTAASQGLVRIAKELLKLGLDVNAPDENKDPALHCAAEHGQVEMVKLLLEHGANPNARDGYFGDTALHVSAKQSYWRREQNVSPGVRRAVAEVLLSAGIKLDARNGRGEMTLHAAVETGDLDLVRFLVEKGADVNATDWSDRTVLDHAQDRPWIRKEPPDKDAIIIYLREHGAK